MSYRVLRVRRDALTVGTEAVLRVAAIGDRVRLAVYGVTSDAVITDLNDTWVEFRSGDSA